MVSPKAFHLFKRASASGRNRNTPNCKANQMTQRRLDGLPLAHGQCGAAFHGGLIGEGKGDEDEIPEFITGHSQRRRDYPRLG